MDTGIGLLFGGLAVALNVIIILVKVQKGKVLNSILDASFLLGVLNVFSGSYAAMMVGTWASLAFSAFLFIKPPKFTLTENPKFQELKKEFNQKLAERNE